MALRLAPPSAQMCITALLAVLLRLAEEGAVPATVYPAVLAEGADGPAHPEAQAPPGREMMVEEVMQHLVILRAEAAAQAQLAVLLLTGTIVLLKMGALAFKIPYLGQQLIMLAEGGQVALSRVLLQARVA